MSAALASMRLDTFVVMVIKLGSKVPFVLLKSMQPAVPLFIVSASGQYH